ncbi:MAG: restriction endonuclease subunit S [Pseudomonadota bacterium]
MNADRLLALYELVAEAPDAIARLRRFVLDLAVRGKLVAQDADDEPASELLKRIAAEKAQLVKAGEIRKSRKEADLSGEDPYHLPAKWLWVPFDELHHLVRGVTYSKGDVADTPSAGFVPILRANNIGPTLTYNDAVYVKAERVSTDQYLRHGDYMIALSSGSKNLVGKAALVPETLEYAFGGFCGAIRLFDPVLVGFVGVFLSSDLYRESISAGSRGIGINNLKKEVLANLYFPLPPLAEQRRIVAKVEELMALLDRLEAARTAREATRDRLTAASLARLTAHHTDPEAEPGKVGTGFPSGSATTKDSFTANARFALATLPALTTRPDQIKPLRQTILNLAVRGKLVAQDAGDEPASELLKRIDVWRHESVRKKEIRLPRKELKTVSEPEEPYLLPNGWSWARLGQLIYIQSGDGLTSAKMKDGPVPVFGGNGITGYHDAANTSEPTIVIGRVGYYCGSIHVTPSEAWITDNAFRTKYSKNEIHREFLELLLNATDLKEQENATAQPVISGMKIYPIVVGLPPLAEQHRIVAKVDALMALCDRLEAALTTADTTRARLLDALLHEALNPAAEAITEAAE